MFQKQINNLDPSPDLEPSYTMASPLKYAKIHKKKKPSKIMFTNLLSLLQTENVYVEAPITFKRTKKT